MIGALIPELRQAEPHTDHGKEKETHELIFSWLSWLAVLLDDDGVAQHGGHTPNNRLTETYSLGLPCISDIGHPCYDQLTPVKTSYPLTSIK